MRRNLSICSPWLMKLLLETWSFPSSLFLSLGYIWQTERRYYRCSGNPIKNVRQVQRIHGKGYYPEHNLKFELMKSTGMMWDDWICPIVVGRWRPSLITIQLNRCYMSRDTSTLLPMIQLYFIFWERISCVQQHIYSLVFFPISKSCFTKGTPHP